MLQQMIHIIGGMKDETKLGKLLGAVVRRLHEIGGPKPSVILKEMSAHMEENGE